MYHYNLDSMAIRDRLVFGWGWFLDSDALTFPVSVVLRHQDESVSTVLCLRSGTRADVAEVFPDVAHAAASGFMVQGRLNNDSPVLTAKLILAGTADNGSACEPEVDLGSLDATIQRNRRVTPSRVAKILRRRGLRANLSLVSARLRGHVLEILAARFRPRRVSSRRGAVLIFDHDLGGGANAFRRQLINRLRQTMPTYLIVPRVPTLDYCVILYDGTLETTHVYERLDELIQFLAGQPWTSIIINELVSYPDPMAMVRWLGARASAVSRPPSVTFYLHDFYAVCPQWTLVGRRGVYCGVPEPEECVRCLKSLRIPFLPYLSHVSIRDWRAEWEPLLRRCSIRAFSASSVEIFRKAFPSLHDKTIDVEPHNMDYFKGRPVDYHRNVAHYRVGVVGHINGPKGAAMVELAARIIQKRALPIELVIFGSIDATGHNRAIIHAGKYSVDNLAHKLEEYEINAAWVPSVCPETYSYVTSELIRLGVPLVCFDVGAPAERISRYHLGRVFANFDTAAVVDYFVSLRQASLITPERQTKQQADNVI